MHGYFCRILVSGDIVRTIVLIVACLTRFSENQLFPVDQPSLFQRDICLSPNICRRSILTLDSLTLCPLFFLLSPCSVFGSFGFSQPFCFSFLAFKFCFFMLLFAGMSVELTTTSCMTNLLRRLIKQFKSLVFPPPTCLVDMKFSASCASTGALDILHHLSCWPHRFIFWSLRDMHGFCRILEQLVQLQALPLDSSGCMPVGRPF